MTRIGSWINSMRSFNVRMKRGKACLVSSANGSLQIQKGKLDYSGFTPHITPGLRSPGQYQNGVKYLSVVVNTGFNWSFWLCAGDSRPSSGVDVWGDDWWTDLSMPEDISDSKGRKKLEAKDIRTFFFPSRLHFKRRGRRRRSVFNQRPQFERENTF